VPERVYELLREDFRYQGDAMTSDQRAAISGQAPRKHGGSEWADSDEGRQRELERVRSLPRFVDSKCA